MASLMPRGRQRYTDSNGNNLAGGKLYAFAAGTSTPLATYSDQAGATPNAHPIVLNARGEATVFWGSSPYKVVLKDASDVEIWSQDDLHASADIADLASTASGKGAALVGYSTEAITVKAALDERLPEIGTYALLQAYSGALTAYYVRGVANLFDGGHGVFRVDAADTTSADNGGTILVDAAGRRWRREFAGAVSVKWFGATGDDSTDDTSAMQAAHDREGVVYYPAGGYRFTVLTIAAGGIIGDGPAGTRLLTTDATTADAITYTGTGGDTQVPIFRDFKLEAINTKSAGAGVRMTPASGELEYALFDNVTIYNLPRGLQFDAASKFKVVHCNLINYSDTGVFVENSNSVDSGDSLIQGCFINTGLSSGSRYGIYQLSSGGLRVIGNKILGGTGGYVLDYNANTASGPLVISGNSIENVAGYAVFLGHNGAFTGAFGGIVISGNEIAVCDNGISTDTTGAFTLLTITGNYVDLNNTTGTCLFIDADKFIASGNTLQGGLEGLRVHADATNGRIGKNLYAGNTTALVNGSSTTYLEEDVQSGVVASITHTTAFGAVFHGSSAVVFPVAFKTTPVVNCNAGGGAGVAGGFGGYATNVTTTGFDYNLIGAVSGSTSTNEWSARGVL